MASKGDKDNVTLDDLETELATDTKVKLAGLDVDGTRASTPTSSFR